MSNTNTDGGSVKWNDPELGQFYDGWRDDFGGGALEEIDHEVRDVIDAADDDGGSVDIPRLEELSKTLSGAHGRLEEFINARKAWAAEIETLPQAAAVAWEAESNAADLRRSLDELAAKPRQLEGVDYDELKAYIVTVRDRMRQIDEYLEELPLTS